jgi:hypothetical protein
MEEILLSQRRLIDATREKYFQIKYTERNVKEVIRKD